MKRTTIFLRDSHIKKLNDHKKKTGVHQSEFVRRAIDHYYKKLEFEEKIYNETVKNMQRVEDF